MHQSLWSLSQKTSTYPPLSQHTKTDICIVGAGITGITLAYLLKDTPLTICLIDSDRVSSGTTAYTTAKMTAQHDLIYHELIHTFGHYDAKCYANAQFEALDFISQTIKQHRMDCEFERKFSAIYTQNAHDIPLFEKEYAAYQELGLKGRLVKTLDLPFPIECALILENQAQFNPVKYTTALLEEIQTYPNIRIYEQTAATDIKKKDGTLTVCTSLGYEIEAQKVVQTSHYPFYDDLSFLFAKMEAQTSYLMACEGVKNMPEGMYLSYGQPTRSIRTYQNYLLVGGEDHRTGTKKETTTRYEALTKFATQYFAPSNISYRWSTEDYDTVDRLPYIGQMKQGDQIFVATGFKKWGMTTSTVAALLLKDLILGQESPYASLFNPNRQHIAPQIKNLIRYNAQTAWELVKGKLRAEEDLSQLTPGEAVVLKLDEGKYGVYMDEQGETWMVDLTCPHLGCELSFNHAERTWDCPCHGSRFDVTGTVVSGPAHCALKSTTNRIDPNLF